MAEPVKKTFGQIVSDVLLSVKNFLNVLKELCVMILKVAVPVAGGMIAMDVLAGTKFGVLERTAKMVQSVGVSETGLAVMVYTVFGIYVIKAVEKLKK